MSIVMLIVVSRSINKAYFWGKHNYLYFWCSSALAIFVGYIIVNLSTYLF